MKLQSFILVALFIYSFINCKRENNEKSIQQEYFVISNEDSISKMYHKTHKIRKPIMPIEIKWYTDLVFIMGDKDKVYIYQTEKKYSHTNIKFNYPNYIGLRPEYLITVESKDFVSFLKNNNDIFGIFPNKEDVRNVFYIASETDTIKNAALLDLYESLNKEKSHSSWRLRLTTEEENIILKFKRSGEEYDPELINWSSNFYNGRVRPFTKEYKDLEKEFNIYVNAKESFRKKIKMVYL